ncbi:MAG: DUF6029 family protein [Candidatus Eisenbacteria bacterium]|nr:DUF6029 family protein [Candidatus Eisenbacteria bacterium]
MSRSRPALALAALLVAAAGSAGAQVSGTNILEFQNGNIPFTLPENRWDLYEQLNLEYRREKLQLGLRFESDRSSDDSYPYDLVTQRFAAWSTDDLRFRVGNFYSILGRGLLHRSFELPGVVLDQPGLRSRYAPSRDVDGALVEARHGRVAALALAGSANVGNTSPGLEPVGLERYSGEILGGQVAVEFAGGGQVGAGYLRDTGGGATSREYGTGFAAIDLLQLAGVSAVSLPVYLEQAIGQADFGDWWRFDTGEGTPHALYAAANLIVGGWALSAEWKDYHRFRLGTNDPPSLVREQSWSLLNRATHVLDADTEQGFQLEGTGSLPGGVDVTANLSRSDGSPPGRTARFEEHYLELHVAAPADNRWEAGVFFDRGRDEFVFVRDREAFGLNTTVRLSSLLSVTLDLERLDATRGPESFTDFYYAATLARAGTASLSLVMERTSDPQEQPDEPDGRYRRFLAGVGSVRLAEGHDMSLSYGSRRGGRACTAGTCYEVLSFEGLEVRLTSRF